MRSKMAVQTVRGGVAAGHETGVTEPGLQANSQRSWYLSCSVSVPSDPGNSERRPPLTTAVRAFTVFEGTSEIRNVLTRIDGNESWSATG